MKVRPLAALAAALLGATLLAAPAEAADPAYPTGTYSVYRTSGFAYEVDLGDVAFPLYVFEESASDDVTPSAQLTRVLDDGNGHQWPMYVDGGYVGYAEYAFAGVYHPKVLLTDGDGHTTEIPLPAITVYQDKVAPASRLTVPLQKHRISKWHVLRGTARDTGGTGLDGVEVRMVQKWRGTWYAYDFFERRWIRGGKKFGPTYAMSWKTRGGYAVDDNGRWHSPMIKGLKRGRLVIRITAEDNASNIRAGRGVDVRLWRR